MRNKKPIKLSVLAAALSLLMAACGNGAQQASQTPVPDSGVTNIRVAYDQVGPPMSWVDENGNATGYDVEVLRLVNELLPQYSFEFIGTSSDDLLLGVEQGKFDMGVKNAFWTQERTEKFLFPQEFLGLSGVGMVLRSEHKDIQTLAQFAEAGLSLAPMAANNAQYTIIEEYNQAHPDQPVNLLAGDTFTVDVVQWVEQGRVDGGVMIQGSFQRSVIAENGAYHNFADRIVLNEFAVIKTWPLFNKEQQALADAYDKAIAQLKQEGKLNALMIEFYNKDYFEFLDNADR